MSATAYCEQCGTGISSGARFCTACGAEQPTAAGDQQNVLVDEPLDAPRAAYNDAAASEPQASFAAADGGAAGRSASSVGQLDWNAWPVISGLPLELWLVIAAFALPGAWVTIKIITALPDAVNAMGSSFFGFRIGLALFLLVVLVGLVGVAMLVISWRLYNRDRVGRGLAYAFAGTLVVSIAFSNDQTAAERWAMIFSIVGIVILAMAPRVRRIFDEQASSVGEPTSVVVSRMLIAIFSAFAVLVAVIYILLSTISGKYAAAGIIALLLAAGAMRLSRGVSTGDRQARLFVSIGAAGYIVLLLALGRASAGLLIPIGLAGAAVLCLWIPNDARAFFGDSPLSVAKP